MRLTCPNCDAIYEVPADAVPMDGREVQCTNCGHSWFQEHPEAALPEERAPEPAAQEPETPSSRLDPAARQVLEEEAERELAVRAEERGRARKPKPAPIPRPVEASDADDPLGEDIDEILDEPDDEPDAYEDGPLTGAAIAASAAAAAAEERKTRRGRDLLPDIEEINGSLKPASERRGGKRVEVEEAPPPSAQGRGFRLGFGLMVLTVAALAAIYVFSAAIAETFPPLAPSMAIYAETVDGWRLALDDAARGAAEALTGWVDRLSAEAE